MDIKMFRFANPVKKMLDVSLSFSTTKQVQHTKLRRVLWWSTLSLLVGGALQLVVLPCCMITIAALDTAHMYPAAFSCTTLTVESEANVSAVWCLRHQVKVTMLSLRSIAFLMFAKPLLLLKLAFALAFLAVVFKTTFLGRTVVFVWVFRRCQGQGCCEECFLEVRVLDHLE